jgi:malonate transporter and related proteins
LLEVLAVVVPLYVLIVAGLVAGRTKIFHGADGSLNSFVYWFALPAFLFDSIVHAPPGAELPPSFFIVTFLVTLAFSALIHIGARLARLGAIAGQLSLAAGFGNVAYFAFPVILSVVGPQAALPMALASMVHNIVFMVGYPVLASLRHAEPGQVRRALMKAVPLNPTIVSVVLALVVRLAGWGVPELVAVPITFMAQSVIPVALFAVGLALGPAIKAFRTGGQSIVAVLLVSVLKLVAMPLLTWGAVHLFVPDPTGQLTAVLVLMAAMPTGVTSFTLAQEFDGDGRMVAAIVAVSTLLALGTVAVFGVLVA